MPINLFNPVALLALALLIPVIYSAKWKRKILKSTASLFVLGVVIILLYPLIFYLSNILGTLGYTIGKFIIFMFLPIVFIYYTEKRSFKEILLNAGVRKRNLRKSVIYGLAVAVITIVITIFVSTAYGIDVLWGIIMFFESFTEEFFFRGVLFLYLLQKTNLKIAYSTSIIGFILIHPQHFNSIFIVSTIAQAVLLTMVTHKTKNIIGPWISHGLNRIIPSLIRAALG